MLEKIEGNTLSQENNIEIEKIKEINYSMWKDSLGTKDPSEVAKLYSKDAIFLPTKLGKLMEGQEGAREYFIHFLEKDPAVIGTTEERIAVLGEDSYLHAGHYDFELGPEEDRQVAEARFSFIWKKEDEEWKIIHHHSSLNPDKN